jgi:hypothetical protein
MRRILAVLLSFTAFGLRAAIAQAQGPAEREIDVLDDNVQPQPQGRLQHFLPGALSVEMDASTSAVGTGWAGYNSASSMPVFNATAEAWIVPRVSVVAGFGSTAQAATGSARAQGGARVLVLDQGRHGVNAGLAFVYRQDRFTNEGGMLEWSAMLSRRWGADMAIANLAYAQDGEGDDHEAEIRLVGVRDLGGGLHVALDNRVRTLLSSSDPHRAQHSNPTLEFNAGPLLAYTVGKFALATEAGVSGQKVDRLRAGVLVLGGMGASF